MNLKNPLKDTIFQRFFLALFSRTEDTANAAPIVPSMEQYREAMSSLQKLKRLSADRLQQREALQSEIEAMEAQRIDSLSQAAMQGSEDDSKTAGKLLKQIQDAKQQLADLDAVQQNIQAKIQTEDNQVSTIYHQCKAELGRYLNNRFQALASHYHELSPEISETVLQIQAVQELMVQLHTGNSNGFDGGVRLPTIEHGNGNTLEPCLEAGSVRYRAMVNDRKEALLTELRAQGYPTRR